MTNAFCVKIDKSLKRFLEYSHNIDKYNTKRHNFIKCELDAIKKIEDKIAKEKGLAVPSQTNIKK
ncbi:hypothetical protein FACS1894166_01160 [Bacilli bacterium]|nr:hypothetical protein FACS1894166_01160 [Bacilli bacterium]